MEPPTVAELLTTIVKFINYAYFFGGFIFLAILTLLGFTYMTSRGDSDKIEEVKRRMGYLVVGMILLFLSYAIVFFIFTALGVKDLCEQPLRPGLYIIWQQKSVDCPSP